MSKHEVNSSSLPELEKWNLPDWIETFDAVQVAPEFHQVIFENDQIRMLSIVIKPGEVEPIHTHKWKSVLWFASYSPSVYTGYQLNAKNELEVSKTFDIPKLESNTAMELEPEGAHTVKNVGKDVLRLYRLELKR